MAGKTIQEVQAEFEKSALTALKRAVHQISIDAFSVSATRFLQIMNLNQDFMTTELLDHLSFQQMIWEDLNRVKSLFFTVLSDLGATAPTVSSPLEDRRDFAVYCEAKGFIGELSKVMTRYKTYPDPPETLVGKSVLNELKPVLSYVLLRHAQLQATKVQFLEDVSHRWGVGSETLENPPYTGFEDLVRIQSALFRPEENTNSNRNKIQELLEFPGAWQEHLATLPQSELLELEQIILMGTVLETAQKLISIANDSKRILPDFPIFKTYLQLFGKVNPLKRSEEQCYFEDFLYAIWKEGFTNTILTLRESGLQAAQEVWNQMYQDLDFNTDMLIQSAEQTQLFSQLEELDKTDVSMDDIRNQFMDQFLRDEIPGVVKAVRGFLVTLQKEDNEPVRIETARAFRMTESSLNVSKQGQMKEIAELVADVLESDAGSIQWIRKNSQDIEDSLLAIESLRMIALEEEVLTLEKIELLDSVTSRWKKHILELKIDRSASKSKSAEPKNLNFKDDSGFDFFGDLTGSLGDDLESLDFGALEKE